ncbi:MAG: macro domain-containing protein [Oscillospiraceae bacterium]|nr:macro domain-containing protein [Oscillospiraceae bacterium]
MEVHMIRDDITHMDVDAIMNPTNSGLYGVSGIDGLVHKAGGSELEAQCSLLRPICIGEAVLTLSYGLPCKKIVHVAVPRWRGGLAGEKLLLKNAYLEGLRAAFNEPDIHSLAIPLMGSGGYKFPMSVAFNIANDTLQEFCDEIKRKRRGFTVYLVMYSVKSMIEVENHMMSIMENIDDEYAKAHPNRFVPEEENPDRMFQLVYELTNAKTKGKKESLDEYIENNKGSFQATLFAYIQKSGMTDPEIYNSAELTKSHFSKLKKEGYNVQKDTVLRLAVALKLSQDETKDLLESAGFTYDRSKVSDLVFEYYIMNGKYDLDKILCEIDDRLAE